MCGSQLFRNKFTLPRYRIAIITQSEEHGRYGWWQGVGHKDRSEEALSLFEQSRVVGDAERPAVVLLGQTNGMSIPSSRSYTINSRRRRFSQKVRLPSSPVVEIILDDTRGIVGRVGSILVRLVNLRLDRLGSLVPSSVGLLSWHITGRQADDLLVQGDER